MLKKPVLSLQLFSTFRSTGIYSKISLLHKMQSAGHSDSAEAHWLQCSNIMIQFRYFCHCGSLTTLYIMTQHSQNMFTDSFKPHICSSINTCWCRTAERHAAVATWEWCWGRARWRWEWSGPCHTWSKNWPGKTCTDSNNHFNARIKGHICTILYPRFQRQWFIAKDILKQTNRSFITVSQIIQHESAERQWAFTVT